MSADRPALFFHTTPVNLRQVVGLHVAVHPSTVTLAEADLNSQSKFLVFWLQYVCLIVLMFFQCFYSL